jgi:enoyl-CoA hydratase
VAVEVTRHGPVMLVTLDRPESRNAVDTEHARLLHNAFLTFESDDDAAVAVLHGAGGTFCSGADLRAVADGSMNVEAPGSAGPAPMGPTRMLLSKPVIAAVEGYAVAGGLELAIWCDLRVADPESVLGVFSRRWGVPLIDGGTVRLPRLIGQSHALDMILTGRPVHAAEARSMGLVNRVSAPGKALAEALSLAEQLASFPQQGLREDRQSVYAQAGSHVTDALLVEWAHGSTALSDAVDGASRFADGAGRGGSFTDIGDTGDAGDAG